jgi:hypothetical protein
VRDIRSIRLEYVVCGIDSDDCTCESFLCDVTQTVYLWTYNDNAFDREPSGIFPIAYNQTPVRPLPKVLLNNGQ